MASREWQLILAKETDNYRVAREYILVCLDIVDMFSCSPALRAVDGCTSFYISFCTFSWH
jgi:hypothetical protein